MASRHIRLNFLRLDLGLAFPARFRKLWTSKVRLLVLSKMIFKLDHPGSLASPSHLPTINSLSLSLSVETAEEASSSWSFHSWRNCLMKWWTVSVVI